MLYLSAGFVFGGAKPVPVNAYRLRRPLRDMMFVALAGPVSNFLLAIVFAFLLKVVIGFRWYTEDQMMGEILFHAVSLNLLLAAFNMIPIPPLDGSRVMAWILPSSIRSTYVELERYGLLLVMAFVFLPFTRGYFIATVSSVIYTLSGVVEWIVDPAVRLLQSLAGMA